MSNYAIREAAKKNEVRLWEIAYALGMEDSTFSRKLRRELPQKEQAKILGLIDEIARSKQKEENLCECED